MTFLQQLHELIYRRLAAFGLALDRAVGEIPHPADYPEPFRRLSREPAVADTLHSAVDDPV